MKTLRDYEIIKELGRGSQGVVYKAKRKPDGKIIALKVMKINPFREKDINTAKKEVEFLKTLSEPECNPFVICYYGSYYDENGGKFLIEMEYIEGIEMFDFVQKVSDPKMMYYYLLLIARDVAQGLKYIHSKNIIHRDIKLENIIIEKDTNIPKIIDFGLSCFSENSENPECKSGGGTVKYLSPEFLHMNLRFPASDMWALGVTLYVGAIGSYPYKGYNNRQIINNIKNIRVRINTPNKLLNKIINGLLIPNKDNRLTAQEVIDMTENVESTRPYKYGKLTEVKTVKIGKFTKTEYKTVEKPKTSVPLLPTVLPIKQLPKVKPINEKQPETLSELLSRVHGTETPVITTKLNKDNLSLLFN